LIVVAAVAGALVAGGGVAYALTPTTQDQIAALEAPDGTQPTGDDAVASVGPTDPVPSTAPMANVPSAAPSVAPTPTTTATTTAPTRAPETPATGCAGGEREHEVAVHLTRIGGYGDAPDCAAIARFQTRYGISPANGKAGTTTLSVARRISTSVTADERARCGAGPELTACIDLTLQTVWVVRNGEVVFGPTVTRTGMSGYATPAGTYRVFNRSPKAWSTPYKVWLYNWQNFVRGIGFHSTTTYLHNGSIGSHGCVNLLSGDAKALYNTIGQGTTVRVFGRRPGT
jgi:lipoprotein-anchoring transpeptidase ErfK/SrfK